MKTAILFVIGVGMTTTAWGADCDSSTVVIGNGDNLTSVTQSGDCTSETMRVEPGKTWLYRKSGGNVSITMQQSTLDPATLARLAAELRKWGKDGD